MKRLTLDIYGQIGEYADYATMTVNVDNTLRAVRAKLEDAVEYDEIVVNIDSVGGSLAQGLSIHDLLKSIPVKKVCRITGMTASAATIIAMACDTITMSDNAFFLVHRASMPVVGNANDMLEGLEDLVTTDAVIADIYAKRTGLPLHSIMSLMDENAGRGKWLTAKTARRIGLVDEVFEPGTEERYGSRVAQMVNDAGMPDVVDMLGAILDDAENM